MSTENGGHHVIGITVIGRVPIHSPKLNEGHIPRSVKQPPGDKNLAAKVINGWSLLTRHRSVAMTVIVPAPLLWIVVLLCGSEDMG